MRHLIGGQEALEEANVLLCGDFNAKPDEETYRYLADRGYISSYKAVHKEEPSITFPTGLQASNMDTDPPGTFDYVWVRGPHLSVKDASLFGDQPKIDDDTIYPSDHMGVLVHLEIE